MIAGKCSNPPRGYGAAEQWRQAAAPKGLTADGDAAASCKELVAQGKFRPRAVARLNHPDASFVTHLIATVEQAPQTRALRRASLADAMSYYDAMTKVTLSGNRATTKGSSRLA